MFRRWLAWVLGCAIAGVAISYLISWIVAWPAAKPVSQPGPLIVVSQPTLSWDQVSPTRTPTLWRLATEGAAGSLATRTLTPHSCSSQAWLTFAAGTRTTYGPAVPMTPPGQKPLRCPSLPAPTPSTTGFTTSGATPTQSSPAVAGTGPAAYDQSAWTRWRSLALKRPVPADIASMGTRLPRAGQCITAAGRYAGLAAADQTGRIAHYSPSAVGVDPTACPVTLVDLPAPNDTELGKLLARAPANATVVVAGLADDTGPEVLHTVVISGPGVPHGLLTSVSTQQPGILQTTDLSALVLDRLGAAAPHLPEGRPPMVQPRAAGTSAITDARTIALQLRIEHGLTGDFIVRFVAAMVTLFAVGVVWWLIRRYRARRRGVPAERSRLLRGWFAGVGALTASMPVATWLVGLVPWWQASEPRTALGWSIVGIAMVIGLLALAGPWRRHPLGPPLFIAAVTGSVLLLDAVHGTPLQLTSIMGLQPVYGGRFYGMGNVGGALLSTSGLLIAACLAGVLQSRGHQRLAAATVILIALVTLLIDGTPIWGADGAGPLTMFPAFAYLALNAAGIALTWRRAALIIGSAVVIVGIVGVLDYLRPPEYRTHLGDFVSQVRNHGQFTGVERIVKANWTMLTSTWYTALVPLILVLAVVALLAPSRRPGSLIADLVDRVPMLGQGLAAITVCWLLGFVANDSGVSIPPTGMLLLAPLLILLAARMSSETHARRRLTGTLAHRRPSPEQADESQVDEPGAAASDAPSA
ncbi:hypothetical protein HJ588_02925 [Flexivirga sp. ID2601S]|uniref:Uncharacterized protein n=1 Tax=Flexivirga aerilata TaxID=1656889 RepID=A0A849AF76_9MICO|nr:hypothetical protein [Flexivirga aerilata]NNG38226.1 hypothetical protein [Flexivirga aerilata]